MEKVDLQAFMAKNNLKPVDLATYWGVTRGAVSQVLSGLTKLSTKRLEQLIDNPNGWDVSSLTGINQKEQSDVENLLRDLLAEKEMKIDTLNEVIWELKEEIGRLQELLRQASSEKGKSALIADSSSVANVG